MISVLFALSLIANLNLEEQCGPGQDQDPCSKIARQLNDEFHVEATALTLDSGDILYANPRVISGSLNFALAEISDLTAGGSFIAHACKLLSSGSYPELDSYQKSKAVTEQLLSDEVLAKLSVSDRAFTARRMGATIRGTESLSGAGSFWAVRSIEHTSEVIRSVICKKK